MSDICVEAFIVEESVGSKIKMVLTSIGKFFSSIFTKIAEKIKDIIEKLKSRGEKRTDKPNKTPGLNPENSPRRERVHKYTPPESDRKSEETKSEEKPEQPMVDFWDIDDADIKIPVAVLPPNMGNINTFKSFIEGNFDTYIKMVEKLSRQVPNITVDFCKELASDTKVWSKAYFNYDLNIGYREDGYPYIKGSMEDPSVKPEARLTANRVFDEINSDLIYNIYGCKINDKNIRNHKTDLVKYMTPKQLKQSNTPGYENISELSMNELKQLSDTLLKISTRISNTFKKFNNRQFELTNDVDVYSSIDANKTYGSAFWLFIISEVNKVLTRSLFEYFSSVLKILNIKYRYEDELTKSLVNPEDAKEHVMKGQDKYKKDSESDTIKEEGLNYFDKIIKEAFI